ncbi:MAG: CoA ester lyase [Chloroflexota bacterium]
MTNTGPFRSVLFVPLTAPRFIEKAAQSVADAICLDLEDAVAPDQKDAARAAAPAAIDTLAASGCAVWVRINAIDSRHSEADLDAIVRPGLSAVMLPKAGSAADIARLEEALSRLEGEPGLDAAKAVAIVPLIETPRGILHAEGVCGASPRVIAAAFGAEDFRAQMRTGDSTAALAYPRAHLAVVCAAAGIEAIDTIDTQYSDLPALEAGMRQVRALGFGGKLCIHPAQVPIANEVFRPGEAELAEARAIVTAFERDGLAKGRAAIPLGGKMIDTPIYWRAKRLLEAAERTEK